ncbi:hypothetical protein P691DRAFT_809686 [Macrolepiota fuliginosa MF-IS2]|uniref:Uncharacterized protein n=1 Tax=Macrolepiota fuliginosa MF-IS2 TaxID=1400762 RepID=A0A9P5X1N5_9AGAR|nr:hypothetical protein P691DRAFT_809686 [Macrolepiota fuliginosa MF-IS2]
MANYNTVQVPPGTITLYAIGSIFQALFIGGLVTLGMTCFVLFSRKSQGDTAQRNFWRAYIILLIFINLGFLSVTFLFLRKLIYSSGGQLEGQLCDGSVILIASLTDGVLVWRCYMVQKAFGYGRSRLQNIFWILPLCLWITMMVTGWIGVAIAFTQLTFGSVPLVCNVVLNLFATTYITTRLVLQRRTLAIRLGSNESTVQYFRIVAIFIESATINVPTSLTAAIGVLMGEDFGGVLAFITVCCQSFASVLIIHQVALGRALGQDRVERRDSGRCYETRRPSLVSGNIRHSESDFSVTDEC